MTLFITIHLRYHVSNIVNGVITGWFFGPGEPPVFHFLLTSSKSSQSDNSLLIHRFVWKKIKEFLAVVWHFINHKGCSDQCGGKKSNWLEWVQREEVLGD